MARQDKTSFLRLTLDQQLGVFFRGRILNLLILFGVISSLDLIWQLLVVKICYEIFWCTSDWTTQHRVNSMCVNSKNNSSSFYYFIIDANAQRFGSPKCHIGSFLDFSNRPSNDFFCHFVQRGPFHTVPYLIPIMHHPFATCNTHKAPFNLYLFYEYYPQCTTPQPHLHTCNMLTTTW